MLRVDGTIANVGGLYRPAFLPDNFWVSSTLKPLVSAPF